MTEAKLTRYLRKLEKDNNPLKGARQVKPIILSDSKGVGLRNYVDPHSPLERDILWLCE